MNFSCRGPLAEKNKGFRPVHLTKVGHQFQRRSSIPIDDLLAVTLIFLFFIHSPFVSHRFTVAPLVVSQFSFMLISLFPFIFHIFHSNFFICISFAFNYFISFTTYFYNLILFACLCLIKCLLIKNQTFTILFICTFQSIFSHSPSVSIRSSRRIRESDSLVLAFFPASVS